jgi:hypothetical protein
MTSATEVYSQERGRSILSSGPVAGIILVGIFTALLWMGAIAAGSWALGYAISIPLVAGIGASIGLFVTTITAPLMLTAKADQAR